ncbi:hypothetical protein QTL95_02845 [Rhizobium sp. S152]|nr:hypothetical protein [Rhizobium sp. S152]MDM9624818.1 hypothetical protein [Rhizobium sp. S152]
MAEIVAIMAAWGASTDYTSTQGLVLNPLQDAFPTSQKKSRFAS